jgi:hypothetical protein
MGPKPLRERPLPPQDDDEVVVIAGLIAWRREAVLILDY